MPKQALTKTWIHRQPFSRSGPVDYYDTGCTGLILRIGTKSKTFYHNLPTDGKRGMKKIGQFCYLGLHGLYHEQAVKEVEKIKYSGARRYSGFSKSTLRDYIDNHYRQDRIDANKPVKDKIIDDIKRYYSHALDRPCSGLSDRDYARALKDFPHLSDSSKRKMYYVFNSLLNTLVETDRISTNPLAKRNFKTFDAASIHTHDVSYKALYTYIFSPSASTGATHTKGFGWPSRLITAISIETGARPGEIRKTQISNVHLDDRVPHIAIPPEVSKNEKFRRLPIRSKIIVDALREYVTHHYTPNNEGYLFYTDRNGSYPSQSVYRALWKSIKDEFGLRGRFYDFRHTFATKAWKKTGDIGLVAEQLGDDVATAVKYYTQTASPEEVMSRLEGLD